MTDSVSELGSDHKQPIRSHHQDSLTNERPLLTQCRSWGVKVRAGWLSGHQTSPPDGSNPRQTCISYKSLRDYDYDTQCQVTPPYAELFMADVLKKYGIYNLAKMILWSEINSACW